MVVSVCLANPAAVRWETFGYRAIGYRVYSHPPFVGFRIQWGWRVYGLIRVLGLLAGLGEEGVERHPHAIKLAFVPG